MPIAFALGVIVHLGLQSRELIEAPRAMLALDSALPCDRVRVSNRIRTLLSESRDFRMLGKLRQ
jgi:hypothetical protein